jgi:hypothetical protein
VAKFLIINGVKFRPGEIEWEDACTMMRSELPPFFDLRRGSKTIGKVVTSVGLVARVGIYWIVISEHGSAEDIFDYTLVPMRSKIKVMWTGGPAGAPAKVKRSERTK